MTHIQISKSEYFTYTKVLIALCIVPFLSNIFTGVYNLFPHEPGIRPAFITFFIGIFNLVELIGASIASAYILNLSEKRKNCKDRFWLTMGVFFNITAFICYIIWGLSKEYQFVLEKEHKLMSVKKMISTTFKKE